MVRKRRDGLAQWLERMTLRAIARNAPRLNKRTHQERHGPDETKEYDWRDAEPREPRRHPRTNVKS